MRRARRALLLPILLAGCISTRSEVTPSFGAARPNLGAGSVTVLIVLRNYTQQHDFDTIPKMQSYEVKDFTDVLRDSLKEISNISRYDTWSEMPGDVSSPDRKSALAAARAGHDYSLDIEFLEETSFPQQFLMGAISVASGTLVPVPYDWDYTISTVVTRRDGTRVAQYQRKATLSQWVQACLVVAYPFYPFEGKREEIYSQSLHDTFRQLESEQVLKP